MLHLATDCCEITGRTGRLHAHHAIRRSHSGDDVLGNILMISDDLHAAYHQADTEALRLVATHIVSSRPDTMLYLNHKLGEEGAKEWIRRHQESS